MVGEDGKKQLLHLVFGGELKRLGERRIPRSRRARHRRHLPRLPVARERAWKAKAQATVDNAHMRYFIVHLHRLLDPDSARPARPDAMEQKTSTTAAPRKARTRRRPARDQGVLACDAPAAGAIAMAVKNALASLFAAVRAAASG